MSWMGLDPIRARDVARHLRAIDTDLLDPMSSDLINVAATINDFATIAPIQTTRRELIEELDLTATSLDLHADFIDAADSGYPGYVLQTMNAALRESVGDLRSSIDDEVGSTGSADELRAELEARVHGDTCPMRPVGMSEDEWVATVLVPMLLAEANAGEVAALWNTLTPNQQRLLIDNRPEIVALRLLGVDGVELTNRQLLDLQAANAHPEFTSETFLDVTADINLGVVSIEVGGGLSLVFTKMSDGTVQMVTVQEANIGVARDIGGADADASASLGAVFGAHQVFQFGNEDDAASALTQIMEAVADDADFDFGDAINVGGELGKFALFGPVGYLFVRGSDTPESIQAINDVHDAYGISTAESVGIYGEVSAEFDSDLIEFEAAAHVSVRGYDVDVTERSDLPGRTGVVVTAVVSGDAEGDISGLPGMSSFPGRGSAEFGLMSDTFRDDDGDWFTTMTVFGAMGSGSADEIYDGGAFEVDTAVEGMTRFTYEITVPINEQTTDMLGDAASSIVSGQVPTGALADLYDSAEVSILVEEGSRVINEFEAEAAIVEVEATLEIGEYETTYSGHKWPGGDLYDQGDVDLAIELELAEL